MKYYAMCSGGKDSCAQLNLIKKYNLPCDAVIMSEVMFDKEKGISGENLDHIKWVKETLKPTIESWGYEFIILHSDKDYFDCFHHVIKTAKKYPDHVGKKYGFPISGLCDVKRDLKIKPIDKYFASLNEPYIKYMGIALDEPKRLKTVHKHKDQLSLLEKYNITEYEAMKICRENGILSPTYDLGTNRGGCFFCPNAKLCEHRRLRQEMPDVWNRLVELENTPNIAFDKWNVYSDETLHDRDVIFRAEDEMKKGGK